LAPGFSEYWGPLTHEHVLTRSVRDSAAVLDAIAGPAPGDPYTAPAPLRPYAREVGADPGSLRVGLVTSSPMFEVHADCVRAVEDTARLLEELGHRVEPVRPPALERIEVGPWIAAGIARDLDRWSECTGDKIGSDDVEPLNWALAEAGRALNGSQYIALEETAWAWAREVQKPWSEGLDLLLTPTAANPPPPLGWLAPTVEIFELLQRLGRHTVFTLPFNVTGQPAISLPLHWNEAGLPIGVQLVAATSREDLLFRVGSQLEAARPWAGRRPAVHA
jgi:amidase